MPITYITEPGTFTNTWHGVYVHNPYATEEDIIKQRAKEKFKKHLKIKRSIKK